MARRSGPDQEVLRPDIRFDGHPDAACRRRRDGRAAIRRGSITVAFLGDGATSEGDVHEALNFASVFTAPFVFYVQNNQWAIRFADQPDRRTVDRAPCHWLRMRGVRVDGNDVLACDAVVADAAARARTGEGPTLIEAVTYRLGPHTTSDDPTRYRNQDELDRWETPDPIPRYRAYFNSQGCGPTDRGPDRRVGQPPGADLRDAMFAAPDTDIDEVFTWFAERTPGLEVHATVAAEILREAGRPRSPDRRRSGPQQYRSAVGRGANATPLTMVQAINDGLHEAMAADDRVLVFGEDVATLGGVFRVTEGLTGRSARGAASTLHWLSPR